MQHFKITQNKEERFVEKVFLPLTFNSKYARDLKDDVALLNDDLIIKTDSICTGVHVKLKTDPFKIGWKLMARNLSDIASKGGDPVAFTLAIFKHKNISNNFIDKFTQGLKNFNIPLIGGDFCNSLNSHFSANITLFAKKIGLNVPCRNSANIGDNIYVTNVIGRAFLGFKGKQEYKSFYETPASQIDLMRQVYQKYNITSSIDVSDGFLKDIISLLNASNLGAKIEVQKILPSNYLKYTKEMLTFGDDYQIIFTSKDEIQMNGITKIGHTQNKKVLTILDIENIDFKSLGYQSI